MDLVVLSFKFPVNSLVTRSDLIDFEKPIRLGKMLLILLLLYSGDFDNQP